jgi:hypothetical protein
MVKCYRCKRLKAAENFAWRRKAIGQRDSYCRPCRSEYGKEHYRANSQRYIDLAGVKKHALALERTRYLIDYFAKRPCVDCGETDPVVLKFDHLRDKSFDIGPSLSRRNWDSILAEMEKCQVVCANCHRRRTARRRKSLRLRMTELGEQ